MVCRYAAGALWKAARDVESGIGVVMAMQPDCKANTTLSSGEVCAEDSDHVKF